MKPLDEKHYGAFMKMATEAARDPGVGNGVLLAVIIASGGRVKLTADQILNVLDRNQILRVERVGLDVELIAYSRPRCEKCGRWERRDD